MTNEEKELLIKDLCGRLPYNLYIRVEEFNISENDDRITEGFIGDYLKDNRCNDYDAECILNELADGCINVKPYLRPMSSMTQDEELECINQYYRDYVVKTTPIENNEWKPGCETLAFYHHIEWLNAHHFDYRGLIEKGLALEAPEDMYKN